jgi:mRNA interferase HigB
MKRIIAKKTLRDFWAKYADSEQHLKTWYETTKNAQWKSPNAVKENLFQQVY